MLSRDYKELLPEIYKKCYKLKNLLILHGNRERSTSYMITLLKLLKREANLKNTRGTLRMLKEKDPKEILDKCLYQLMPAFILRRTIVSGKLFELPVPISPNRAFYMSANWLLKAALKKNKCALTIPQLLTQEIIAVLHRSGSALSSQRAYIDIALDQLPFSRYIRKKHKIVARSKIGIAGKILRKKLRDSQSRYMYQKEDNSKYLLHKVKRLKKKRKKL